VQPGHGGDVLFGVRRQARPGAAGTHHYTVEVAY
jgi:hypothetical protein